ncbi:MAG: TIM44-like domain-containing protein [Planctomycetota bacterium]|jgi:predicted lipid-binding transport protein (Tim44 family)
MKKHWIQLATLTMALSLPLLGTEAFGRAGGGSKNRKTAAKSTKTKTSTTSTTRTGTSTTSKPSYQWITPDGRTTSLASLADQYGTTPRAIQSLNPNLRLSDREPIPTSIRIKLKKGSPRRSIVVKSGDSWESLAKTHKTKPESLKNANRYAHPQAELKAGETLYLSGGGIGGTAAIVIIGIIVLIIILAVVFGKKSGSSAPGEDAGESSGPGVAPVVTVAPDVADKLNALQERDSAFNRQMFEDKVSTGFFKIQNAWCARDMKGAHGYVSESVLKRYDMQLESYRTSNTFSRMEDLALDRVEVMDLSSDDQFDTIDVWITATARDYKVDAEGNHVSGSKELTTWDEKWSFIRSVNTVTEEKKDISSDHCPNCGAPLNVNATGTCEYCQAQVTSGEFDWVLAEITQLNV